MLIIFPRVMKCFDQTLIGTTREIIVISELMTSHFYLGLPLQIFQDMAEACPEFVSFSVWTNKFSLNPKYDFFRGMVLPLGGGQGPQRFCGLTVYFSSLISLTSNVV